MALDFNALLTAAHTVAKPYIMEGLKKGIVKIDEVVTETGTVADNLLWADLKESFQIPA